MSGRFRLHDLVLVPGILSLLRVPLAACFPFVVDRPTAALVVLLVAGCTDVLDGWCARRLRQVTETGVVLDGVTDKIFASTVAITLVATGRLSVPAVLLLSTREIGEIPLVVRHAASASARRSRAEQPAANVLGKLVTVLQFVAIAAVLLRASQADLWIDATAVAGALAAVTYWRRSLASTREAGDARG